VIEGAAHVLEQRIPEERQAEAETALLRLPAERLRGHGVT
jgi:hypothetical protein